MSLKKQLKFCPVCDDKTLLVHERVGSTNMVFLVCLSCNAIYDYYYLRRKEDKGGDVK